MTHDPLQPSSPTQPAVVVQPSSRGGGWLNILFFGALALAVGGVAFAVGRTTAPAALAGTGTFAGNGPIVRSDGSFDPNDGGGPRQGRPDFVVGTGITLDGTVTSIDGDQLTLTLASGETMTITLDDATTYHAATDATAADVTVGDDVSVKLDGDRGSIGSGPAPSAGAPSLTAGDVTVRP